MPSASDHGAVEAGERGEHGADQQHEQGEVAEEGSVLAPGEALGEEVDLAGIGLLRALDPVALLAEERFESVGAAGEGEGGAMVRAFEIAVADDLGRALDAAPGGAEAADRADGDGDDDEHPEAVEPGGVEDIEEAEALHRAW